MEKKINVAELLRDCPEGMELNCTLFDNVTLGGVDTQKEFPIEIKVDDSNSWYLTKEGCFHIKNPSAKCVIFPKGKTTWEGFVPPCKFKDGDILVHTQNQRFIMSIYHNRLTELIIKTHCILWDKDEGLSVDMDICCYPDNTRLATEEEKEKLFQAIKDNGYKWNAETKTLEKLIEPKFKVGDKIRHKVTNKDDVYEISKVYDDSYGLVVFTCMLDMKYQDQYELVPNKFDITTLKPFDKVLVRDNNSQEWRISLFSHYNNMVVFKYSCINGNGYAQCVPYEQNENLLGTTNDCDEFYKALEQ